MRRDSDWKKKREIIKIERELFHLSLHFAPILFRRLRFRNIPSTEEPDEYTMEIDVSAEFGFVQ